MIPGDGYDWADDYIFVINPADCSADAELQYFTKAEFPKLAEDGWYDGDGACWNDELFAIGTGFQTSFAAGGAFTLQSSGEVHQDGYTIETDGSLVYMFPVNATARTITFSEVLPSDGYDWQDDFVFVVNPSDCSADAELQYFTKAEFPKLAEEGWYDADGNCWNDEEILPGEGVQTSFASGSAFELNFPAL